MGQRIFLTGLRASGKTALGRALAVAVDGDWRDTDEEAEHLLGMSIAACVAARGWPTFRACERRVLERLCREEPSGVLVVSTGGGIVLDAANRARMRAAGRVFFLDAPVDVLACRLRDDPRHPRRPPLAPGQPPDPVAEMAALRAQRLPWYREAAHRQLDATLPLPELVRLIREDCGL